MIDGIEQRINDLLAVLEAEKERRREAMENQEGEEPPQEIKDLIVLFLAHEVGEGDKEVINLRRISRVLARDWGFYYTATRNLRKVRNLLERYPQLTEEERGLISERIGRVLERVEREPKGLKWKLRAKIGVSKKWYREL